MNRFASARFIKSVYKPEELEETVAEVAFIGVADAAWGERPMALIVLRDSHREHCTAEMIRAHLQGFVAKGVIVRYAVPERVLFVDQLEKTSVGKLDKKALRARYASSAG